MFDLTYMTELSKTLADGFFADRIIDLFSDAGMLDERKIKLLDRMLTFFDDVKRGKSLVESPVIGTDTPRLLGQYLTALAFVRSDHNTNFSIRKGTDFDDMIETLMNETRAVKVAGKASAESAPNVVQFFRFVQEKTLERGSCLIYGRIC